MHFDLVYIFGAGVLTFASPCVLPLVPIYLALVSGVSVAQLKTGARVSRALVTTTAFSVGLALVFIALGMAATALGHALVAHRALLLQLGGLVVFLFGLKQLGVLNVPLLDRDVRPGLQRARRGGILGAFLVGAAFGLGWTPCIGPILGSVLTFTAASTTRPLEGAAYLAIYAGGIATPLIATSAVAPLALRWVQGLARWSRPIQIATGAVLCAIGVLLITDHLGVLDPTSWARSSRPAPAVARVLAGAGCEAGGLVGRSTCELAAADVSPSGESQTIPEGPAMIEFVGRTCPICLRMVPVVQAAERDCAGLAVKIVRIEVDGAGGRQWASRFGVLGVPTFVFIDAKGAEVARLVGEQQLTQLEQSLQVLSGKKCPSFGKLPPGS